MQVQESPEVNLYRRANKIREGSLRTAFAAETKNAIGIQRLCGEVMRDRYTAFNAYFDRLCEYRSR